MPTPNYTLNGGRRYPVKTDIQLTDIANLTLLDAFGRSRTTQPITLFDSKQVTDQYNAIFYDDVQESGAGTSLTYSQPRASYTLSVTAATAGKRIRQTKQRFNYQPGKSQLVLITGVFGAPAAGITRRVGYFDQANGLGLKIGPSGAAFFIRSSTSGAAVDLEIPQSEWSLVDLFAFKDITLDFTKTQIFFIDFEWLGVGSVRFGFVIDGKFVVCYQRNNANALDVVYMSTPNLPVRYEIENDGQGGAASLEAICTSVMSEGGLEDTGITKYISRGATSLTASSSGTLYAVLGIRLKAAALGQVVKIINTNLICTSNPNFEWVLLINPTVAGTFTYEDETNSAVQRAIGATANTVTGGTPISGGYSTTEAPAISTEKSIYYLGSTIAGVPDSIVLCVRPLAANAVIFGGLTVREFL